MLKSKEKVSSYVEEAFHFIFHSQISTLCSQFSSLTFAALKTGIQSAHDCKQLQKKERGRNPCGCRSYQSIHLIGLLDLINRIKRSKENHKNNNMVDAISHQQLSFAFYCVLSSNIISVNAKVTN